MDSERWNEVLAVFDAVVDSPPEERIALLERIRSDDSELYHEVASLLEADQQDHTLLDGWAMDALQLDPEEIALEDDVWIGKRIGPWRIVRRLGTGGMGAVFLAERDDGIFKHQVALKVIRRGMASAEVLRRFRAERQILARLQHPNIARLLDGGVTEEGVPYFAMEYVEGEALDGYCDRHRLTVEERLRLFIPVCAAVQYAHQNLIVHRDLKPSNIFVDKEGVPKLLDFGISKVLDEGRDDLESVLRTRTGMRVMTPEYAAPEQVRGEAATTATDVYALGIILYELLAGRRPHEFPSSSPLEMERVLSGSEPSRPSTVVYNTKSNTLYTSPEAIGQARRLPVERLRKRLSGDLDIICLKALRTEPERRYASAGQLQEDIKRHLGGLPVLARPDSVGYRAQKFVRRHQTAVVMVAAMVILISILVGFYTVELGRERDRAMVEADKAREVSAFLLSIFKTADPSVAMEDSVSARQLLDRGARRIERDLATQPQVRVSMMETMAQVYMNLGLYKEAHDMYAQALEDKQTLFIASEVEIASTLRSLARVLHGLSKYDESERRFREALAIQQDHFGDLHAEVAETKQQFGALLADQDNYTGAEALYLQALNTRRRLHGDTHLEVAFSLGSLAQLAAKRGNLAAADSLFRRTLNLQRKLLRLDHPDLAVTSANLAWVLFQREEYDAAERYYRQAIAIDEYEREPGDPILLRERMGLARVLLAKGAYGDAEKILRLVLAEKPASLHTLDPQRILAQSALATSLLHQGHYTEAETLLVSNRRALETAYGASDDRTRAAKRELMGLYETSGQRERVDIMKAEPGL